MPTAEPRCLIVALVICRALVGCGTHSDEAERTPSGAVETVVVPQFFGTGAVATDTGNDLGVLTLPARKMNLTEAEKIERLLSAVETLKGATFIRNGSEHTPEEAVSHLRRKLASDSESRESATAFIERLASQSSLTGEPYVIQMSDGSSVNAKTFLTGQLAVIDAP